MDFNLDDPLAGILSDGSDDSFFDDDVLGKKNSKKKSATSVTNEKKKSLFDIDDDKPLKTGIQNVTDKKDTLPEKLNLGAIDTPKKGNESRPPETLSPAPFRRTLSKDSLGLREPELNKSFNKNEIPKSPLDSKSRLISNEKQPPKPIARGKSSQSLLDDILGSSSNRNESSQIKTTKSHDTDLDLILGKTEPKKATPKPAPAKSKEEKIKDVPLTKKEPSQTKKSDDWLGLFKEEEDEAEGDSGMPSWLLGADAKKKKTSENPAKPVSTSKVQKEPKDEVPDKEVPKVPDVEIKMPVPTTASVTVNEDLTAEGAAMYLQQQESQLMVAMQLKAQEEKLSAMLSRQEENAKVHREAAKTNKMHVEEMLRRQAEQRSQMQAVISAHQDRISQRIKALLAPRVDNDTEDGVELNEDLETKLDAKDTPHTKEKKQLLQLVQSLQENHDKEIDLMETSYRRQITFLEISLNQAEERMKEENEKMMKFYTEKILWIEEHHQKYKDMVNENMAAVLERNKAENEMLRQQHLENARILQEHHAGLVENIRNALKHEQALIQDSATFSSSLVELVADVKESKTNCQELADKVRIIAESCQRDSEMSLKARDLQLYEMMTQLKKEKENLELEKTENREIIKSLESRLKQMTLMIEEESAVLKQKRMEFEFEKATFNKQTEFAKNVLKNQDEEVKMLKQDIQKEYQDKIAKIDEEKARIQKDSMQAAKEKTTAQHLREELENMKRELQIQLEEVADERTKMNVEKQQIMMEGQRVASKNRELDALAKTAIEKQNQADTKHSEAENLKRKYEERIRKIQEHVVSLNAREKQIAKEKVALSRERLSLHNERKNFEGLHCSLCKSSQNNYVGYDNFAAYENVSRDYVEVVPSQAMNALESEMAHLLSRNYGSRSIGDEMKVTMDGCSDSVEPNSTFKDYMDPKFMMLRLDVQKVISNLNQATEEVTEEDPMPN